MRRDEMERVMEDSGCPRRASGIIAGLWASERHEWRSEETVLAAPGSSDPEKAFWVLADALGVGGIQDIEGTATIRHPAFRRLGKGRWNASDGEAWRAASAEACSRLSGGLKIEPSPHLGFIYASPAQGEKVTFPLPHQGDGEEFRWAYAFCLRACAIAAARELDVSMPRVVSNAFSKFPANVTIAGSFELWSCCLEQIMSPE